MEIPIHNIDGEVIKKKSVYPMRKVNSDLSYDTYYQIFLEDQYHLKSEVVNHEGER